MTSVSKTPSPQTDWQRILFMVFAKVISEIKVAFSAPKKRNIPKKYPIGARTKTIGQERNIKALNFIAILGTNQNKIKKTN